MAGRGGGSKSSLYAALGVASDCSDAELRSAYRKLAMKWHPDKCAGAGSSGGGADAAKARFQKIQGAYAVLSDPNKRILYDVGAYDGEGDDDVRRRGDPRRHSRGHEPGRPCRRQRQGGEPGGPAAAVRGAVPEAVAVVLLAERRSWEVGFQE
ncbi:chaperone protein dnaJ isoform X3 [Zea mays]|uniref:chaperone protein dnaJ isoform X3 n=1 Tax=Zea mays TaxID=4577 RepID=UPI0004DE8377|nr:chaperone protein dnaJ isoform X3 [Zea mays]|eukprot:XP_008679335.1 chaperone protein dnaJ isoform X3 [Zea mays]